MRDLLLVRHAHATANLRGLVSCVPPGDGLSQLGIEQALALRESVARERIDLGVATELRRTQETLELALGARDLPRIVLPELNEIHFGVFEGGPLVDYREWAWTAVADAACPGEGESRRDAALRFADGLDALLGRREQTILAVGHALPIRYVLDASDGRFPASRIEHVEHASTYRLPRAAVEQAAETLRRWVAVPHFR